MRLVFAGTQSVGKTTLLDDLAATWPAAREQVHYVLDEIIMAGMVLETNILHILQAINDQNKLYTKSQKITLGT